MFWFTHSILLLIGPFMKLFPSMTIQQLLWESIGWNLIWQCASPSIGQSASKDVQKSCNILFCSYHILALFMHCTQRLTAVSYLVASWSTSSVFACRSCTPFPVLYPFPLPLATPCPDCTRLSCFSMWATWRRSCCHLLFASSSLFLASSTLKMRIGLVVS